MAYDPNLPPATSDPNQDTFGIPGGTGQRGIDIERRRLRSLGKRGPDLKAGIQDYRQQRRAATEQEAKAVIPDQFQPYVQNPRRFLHQLVQGKGPAFRRLMFARQAEQALGYDQPAQQLQDYYQKQLEAGSPVDLQQDERPTSDAMSSYVRDRLGTGLTPAEEAAYRGTGREAVQGAAQQQYRDTSSRLAAAGIDPRSGIAASRAGQIARGTQQGLSDVERSIREEDLARKGQIEGEAGQQAGLEEQGRQYDVGAQLHRLATVEAGTGNMAGLRERQFENRLGYTESQRQAQMQRDAQKRAAEAMKPTGLETASGIVGGVFQGLGV